MNLAQLQQQLLDYLLHNHPQIQQQLVQHPDEQSSPIARLDIYRNAYQIRLLEALTDNYPCLAALLGKEAFQQLGLAYLAAYPSHHYSVRYIGEQLSAYLSHTTSILSNTTHDIHHEYPADFLAEMAQFEWQLRYAFDAADAPRLQLADLQAIPLAQWGTLVFRLHPSLVRLDLRWNTPALWQCLQANDGNTPNSANHILPNAIQYDQPTAWRIWREANHRTFFRELAVDEAWALDAILQQQNFADICSGLCEWVDEQQAPHRAVEFILGWLNDGLMTEIEHSPFLCD
ncbi:MAG: HvfC/BufC N-terminal domain-containing protein [bacterium]